MTCSCKLSKITTVSELKKLTFEDFSYCVLCSKCNVPTIGALAKCVGVTRLEARRINKTMSDNFSQALIQLGCDKELISAMSPKLRTKYFLENPLRVRELIEECARENKCNVKSLTQKMLLNCPILKAIIPSQLRYTSKLKRQILGTPDMLECCDVLPNNYFYNYPRQAKANFLMLRERVCISNRWPSVIRIREDPVGKKMMDYFCNSVSEMCYHFNEKSFQTHTSPQGALYQLTNVKRLIVDAMKKMGKTLDDLPNVPLKELDRLVKGSIASACSRNHKCSFASLCIQLFPEYEFSLFQFVGGVEDFYWIKKNGDLREDNIRDAVLWLVKRMNSKEWSGNPIDMVPFLKKDDFVSNGLSYIAGLPKYNLLNVLSHSFPELNLSTIRRYGNDNCGERLYHILRRYFNVESNVLNRSLEAPLCPGQSGKGNLRTDLVISFSKHKVHFEIQGPQHIDENHVLHTKSRYLDAFERQVQNDRIKFEHHRVNKNIIIYLKPEQLTFTQVLAESKLQGFDIVTDAYEPISRKALSTYLIDNGFLASQVFD